MLYLWWCAHFLLGLEFPRLPACPSPSIRLLVYLFQWVLFSTRVPYPRDGVTPAGSRIVCPRSERRFSVPIWARYTGQFLDGPHISVCFVSVRPVPQGVLPCGPRCVHELRLSLALSSVLHCPLLGFSVASPTLATGLGLPWLPYPSSCRLGFEPRSVAQLCALQPLAPSFRVVSSSLTLRVLVGSWIFPLCSPDRRSASRSSCSALPPVSRLSFGLGDFSFG